MKNKGILTFLLVFGAFPLLAQVNNSGKQTLQARVETTVLRAQAQQPVEPTEDDPYLLIRAEELLQKDRDAHNGNAIHNLTYYYNWLLQQENTEVAKEKPARAEDVKRSYLVDEQDPYLLIRAEELLQKDRDAHNGNAEHSLEYYYNQVLKQESPAPKYYVPLVQLKEEAPTPGADGAEAGIMWVEIGGEYTADGYEPEYFYLTSKKVVLETNDGPLGPSYEPIDPATFNEAYKRFASDSHSAKATVNQTRQLLTKYYRQVQAEKTAASK